MGRYANRSIRLDFPDLSEDSDEIWVEIRNPKTVSADKLFPADVAEHADGSRDLLAMKTATYDMIAGLIVDWHVYDGDAAEDSEPLGLPATGEAIASLPFEISKALLDEIGKVVTPPQ